MTWIVGIAPPFGYSILVSDVRVSWGKDYQRDCLQKIYPIGPGIIGGFAGSVEIGFHILSALSNEFLKNPERHNWSLDKISSSWLPRLGRRIYHVYPLKERALRSQIILTGVHPSIKLGDSPWPKTDLYTFSSPNFSPKKAKCNHAMAIGCGEAISELSKFTASLTWNEDTLKLAELGHENHARIIALIMSRKLIERSQRGISHHFLTGIAFRDRYIIAPHDYKTYTPEGKTIEVKMPKIAKSYEEFIEMAKSFGLSGHAQA